MRQTIRVPRGAESVRLRFSNPFTYQPLAIDRVALGVAKDASEDPAFCGRVTFGGSEKLVVQPGGSQYSDPIPLRVAAFDSLVLSTFSKSDTPYSRHDFANRISRVSPPWRGDRTGDPSSVGFEAFRSSWAWVDLVEAELPVSVGAFVALGDSITDGAGSIPEGLKGWPDYASERNAARFSASTSFDVIVNAGIGGNTLVGYGDPTAGVNATARLDRDVLSLAGVRTVLVFEGTNDLYLGDTPDHVVGGMVQIAARLRERGIRPLVSTLIPRLDGFEWDDTKELRRQAVNRWIRGQSVYDGVVDFEAVLEDPQRPGHLLAAYDADGTHPSAAGHEAMAAALEPALFLTPHRSRVEIQS